MRVWIVTVGEPIPEVETKDRLHRSGILANYLLEQGHEVDWWGSTFDHFKKTHAYSQDTLLHPRENFRIKLFHGRGYKRNVSISRMVDHWQLGKKFTAAIELESNKPDIILSSFPTVELCAAAVRYGKKYSIPVVLDIRDLWPDIFVDAVPRIARPFARLLLLPLFKQTKRAFEKADGLVGISPGYLKWALGYAKHGERRSDTVLPLGYRSTSPIEVDDTSKESLRKLGVQFESKICWFIGTFGRTYDLVPVIEAARRLQQEGRTGVQFVLSGSGENHKSYEELAKGLDNLVFTGWINSAQIQSMMKVTKIGFAAYRAGAPQGLPNKFFEYLSAGIPILSSLQGEASQLLSEHRCGVTYDASNANDFVEKLSTLIDDPITLNEMGSRGKTLFDQTFSADIIYPELVRYLQRNSKRTSETIFPPGVLTPEPAL